MFFNVKFKFIEYVEKIIKVLKVFVDIIVNFSIYGLYCIYINILVGFIIEYKLSLCKVGD